MACDIIVLCEMCRLFQLQESTATLIFRKNRCNTSIVIINKIVKVNGSVVKEHCPRLLFTGDTLVIGSGESPGEQSSQDLFYNYIQVR